MIESGQNYIEKLSLGSPTEVQKSLIAATKTHIEILHREALKLEEAEEIDEVEDPGWIANGERQLPTDP